MAATALPPVAVVILNWNGWRDTLECLDSLMESAGVALHVIVCDNASSDESVIRLRAWADTRFGAQGWTEAGQVPDGAAPRLLPGSVFSLLHNGANLGFAGGNNPGIVHALSDPACRYVWLLNNDTVVTPDSLAQAVTRMEQDARIGLCGSTLIYYHERHMIQAYGGAAFSPWKGSSRHVGAFAPSGQIPQTPEVIEQQLSYVVGAAMLVRREFIEQVGLMTEDYFLYFEEVDWATRGRGRFTIAYAPGSLVYHKEGASIGTSASGGSPLSVFYLYRNRLAFTKRRHPVYLPSVLAFCVIDIARLVVRRRWPQAKAAINGLLCAFGPLGAR
ncbi:glycosyltransferase [Duganella sp. FT94W]|uniref:Glycosyltransferase n=1 Tax=Duganella lactea TaxID=2692173 RepID=A0ABW9VCQ7_9BURK|nr:glycosyltransferase family 2 protein [Duganella lactea]MYM36490.1 glycosyltransferase [Duganella lactea]